MDKTELQQRLLKDFPLSKSQVMNEIKELYPSVSELQMEKWEDAKILECIEINGEKRYFRRAVRNLFRLDNQLKLLYIQKYGDENADRNRIRAHVIPNLINHKESFERTFCFKFSLTIKADAVADGQTMRCWLPFPRRNSSHQTNIKLLHTNIPDYVISPETAAHSSIYMEQVAVALQPVVFEMEVEFTYSGESHTLFELMRARPLVFKDELAPYLAEDLPHIAFSPKVVGLSKSIVGNERRPYWIVRRIYTWISTHIPWAAAREYSTIPCIPDYVIDNKHGDCGQVSLLLIALCRLNGVPARWVSGFNLWKGLENIHDWTEVYIEGVGWMPVDQSFGMQKWAVNESETYFYLGGIDPFRMEINSGISQPLFPEKVYDRSDMVDFQRGEVETEAGNLYFDQWGYHFEVEEI